MDSNTTLCVGTSFRSINHFECLISRIGGSSIILISFLSILFNLRYLYWSSYHRQNHSNYNYFLFSMFFSSSLVIVTIIPSVILQCLTCSHLCSSFYCQLEGFISYTNGCVHMFMLMMISIIRYNILLHNNTTKQYFRQHSHFAVGICWLFALMFAVPPLFNWNQYIPEGFGFHCGLNWIDRSISSRLYLMFAFCFVYFIPLIVLSVVNIYVYHAIRCLLYRASQSSFGESLSAENELASSLTSSNNNSASTTHVNQLKIMDIPRFTSGNHQWKTGRIIDPIQIHHIIRLNRLRADQRFALATIFLVSEYLLSWTPYACVALLYLFNMRFIIEQPLFITICAYIAKISMIINPFIYILTIKTNQFQVIIFRKKCTCQSCQFN